MEEGEIVTIVTFWTRLMWKRWTVLLVMLLFLGSTLPLVAAASPKSSYPTAGKIVFVVEVNSRPKRADVGTTVVTTVTVSYEPIESVALGSSLNTYPVTLSPETIAFRWVSSAGEKVVENAPVVPTTAGVYEYTQTVGDDFPTGTVTISVVASSCSDGQGNFGPPTDVDSHSTVWEFDNSIVQIGATAPTSSGGVPGFPMESILFGLVGLVGLIGLTAVVILTLLRRRHTSDKASSVRAPER